jgi:2-dehydropantoate 2-reductase
VRFVIFGAGAVGGVIGGLLAHGGADVALIARGEHGAAIARDGLRLRHGDTEHTLRLPVAPTPAELGMAPGDVVILAMKGQDTEAAARALAATADPATPVVCAQNGVANERAALRHFAHGYGICVMLPSTHLTPGIVVADSHPIPGVLNVGRYPTGTDDTAARIAASLRDAGFRSEPTADIMRWKYTKLLANLGNALQAVCVPGHDLATDVRADTLTPGPGRGGGSSWQSLARATGSIEADYLNGEIVLLGRELGIPTPFNENARQWANRFARERREPATLPVAEWLATLPTH